MPATTILSTKNQSADWWPAFATPASRRLRPIGLCVVLCLVCSAASGQQWAASMVNVKSHDFGPVARGSDAVFKFEFTNGFQEDIELKTVSSSCGCTSPSIENGYLKTHQKGYVVAEFNTRKMTGPHSATLTVRLEFVDAGGVRRPGQVQLRVHGDIRGDIVFTPGSIDLGVVDQGTAVQKSVAVTYAGRPGWRIEDVRSTSGDFQVSLVERRRQGRNIAYELFVRLSENAKPGDVRQELVLVTNDGRNQRVPLAVAGRIVPELSAAPATLVLGDVPVGTSVRKRVIIRGKKPFRLTSIDCGGDGCFRFPDAVLDGSGEAKDRHLLQVVFQPSAAGKLKRQLVFRTDRGETYTTSLTAYARVVEAPDSSSDALDGSLDDARDQSPVTQTSRDLGQGRLASGS